MNVYKNGYMDSIADNMFIPDSPASRINAAEALYRLSGSPEASSFFAFSDCPESSVAWAAENKILNGFGDGTVRPNEAITREQLAALVYSYMKAQGKDVSNIEGMAIYEFSDYSEISDWAVVPIRYCINAGIISVGENYEPGRPVTRAELAEVINKLCAL